jgi:hypothetical protein
VPSDTPVAATAPGTTAAAVPEPTCPCSFGTAADTPGDRAGVLDPVAGELGLRFRATAASWVTAVRYYATAATQAERVGSLWAADGQRLGTVRFPAVPAPGWVEARLGQPVALTAGTEYVVSYTTTVDGEHAETAAPAVRSAGPLTSVGAVTGASGSYPSVAAGSKDFWLDVVVVSTAPAGSERDAAAPTVTAAWRSEDSPGVRVLFSERVGKVSAVLIGPDGAVLPAVLTYDPVTLTARLEPSAPLPAGVVSLRVTAAEDLAGNGLLKPWSWEFVVAG